MSQFEHIRIPRHAALTMLGGYARQRLVEQIKAVAFIVIYLVAFQVFVLGSAPKNIWVIAGGIGMVVLGLTLFLEGLILGLMPLGERVGLKLPQRIGLVLIVLFGFLLGVGSTLAEPAVAALRAMGGSVKAWEAPLLLYMLEKDPEKLVIAIGIGVGLAVALGMVRLYFSISIKPFVYVLIPLLLGASIYSALNANLVSLLGLAWDAGAVTTGAVTVPLVLSLGIGVSRSIRHQQGESAGFGMIMLASAIPVLAVLVLGVLLNPSVPRARPETEFFAPENRAEARKLFSSDEALLRHVFIHGSDTGRQSLFADEDAHRESVAKLADGAARREILGAMTINEWLRQRASEREIAWLLSSSAIPRSIAEGETRVPVGILLVKEFSEAIRAVAPLTALLLCVLFFFLRDRLRHNDELALGIGLSLLGMTLLTAGIRIGLAALGDDVGRSLPRAFRITPVEEGRLWIEPFDAEDVFHAYDADGYRMPYFYLEDQKGVPRWEQFNANRYDPETGRYEHVIKRPPLFHPNLTFAGVGLVLLFAFGLGYGSTLAEPALAALGRKVEEISVGTVRRTGVVRSVSVGVGLGLVAGMARLLYDIPTLWLLAPPYVLLLWLTRISDEDFTGIAWDCGGVTTGVVTVPLVMAMGLSVGGELNVVDGFGVLGMASAYPIVTVLTYGLLLSKRQRRAIRAGEENQHA